MLPVVALPAAGAALTAADRLRQVQKRSTQKRSPLACMSASLLHSALLCSALLSYIFSTPLSLNMPPSKAAARVLFLQLHDAMAAASGNFNNHTQQTHYHRLPVLVFPLPFYLSPFPDGSLQSKTKPGTSRFAPAPMTTPTVRNFPLKPRAIGATAQIAAGPPPPAGAAGGRRVVAAAVRCPLCVGSVSSFGRGRSFRMHLLSPVHQVTETAPHLTETLACSLALPVWRRYLKRF